MKYLKIIFSIIAISILFIGCSTNKKSIVVYTAVDQTISEPIFIEFEKETGIHVEPVYDLEANKTIGLVNRIIAERKNPVCDVFWNNEFIQTIRLKEEELLQPYHSINSKDIADNYKDEDGYWTAFGGRARILLVNTEKVAEEDYPTSFLDLLNLKYDNKRIAMAYPLFGTTRTHAAAIYAQYGTKEARKLYKQIADRKIQIVDGNSVARDMVVAGRVDFAYTDTDDAKVAVNNGEPVKIIYPDQNSIGTFICPSTVAMIKGAPHVDEAKIFIDYLLDKKTENRLIEDDFFDLSLRDDNNKIKAMNLSLYDIYEYTDVSSKDMQTFFGVSKGSVRKSL